ncbi:L-threonine aldolase [Cognatiyoonia koreensis]|uniref:L-threonine aldolase n=1 Tax=Cognatiyoonia koreensis TaxID=364200 RepID=A0A1I0MWQ3_9RHOB|nr:beta-eliminating lyase-related protein [Cognatiyoonia koreensis]SEV93064.1 L-threonine aldolase [Cognatiyoonia koreensis]
MYFASDNAGPAHPKVLEALTRANAGYAMGYGADPIMDDVRALIRDAFEAPDAMVHLVINGTAANAIMLATMTDPWDTVFCTPMAHIHEDECNAPEFYTGAKLTLVPDLDAKMTPDALEAAILKEENRGVHGPQRGPVSITQVTEKGTVYTLEEIQALTAVARKYGLKTHLDGARFANAMVALGCTPAEMSWKAGIDAVSFGGTKNGLIGVEACIVFDPAVSRPFELRRKRGGHLLSKHRYLSAQMEAYMTDGLWTWMAEQANARCARLTAGLRRIAHVSLQYEPAANMIFFQTTRAHHKRVLDGGAVYYVMDGDEQAGEPDEFLTGRLVCDWSMTDTGVDQFLALMAG